MGSQIVSTKELTGLRVVAERSGKRVGKVRCFVFHPSRRRVLGCNVHRPDAALMFHRKDLFVSLAGFDIEDGRMVVRDDAAASGKEAIRALGVDWDACVIWVGMPVRTESNAPLGFVGNVVFERDTGKVVSVSAEEGAASSAILGAREIPASLIWGFRKGNGEASSKSGARQGDGPAAESEGASGAIIVADEAAELNPDGGAAAAAGKAAAVISNKAKRGAEKARVSVGNRAEAAKPAARKAAKRVDAAVESGVYAAGKQLGRASGMFAAFKEEFDKAVRDGEEQPGVERHDASHGAEDA